jgi:hypothetical protein
MTSNAWNCGPSRVQSSPHPPSPWQFDCVIRGTDEKPTVRDRFGKLPRMNSKWQHLSAEKSHGQVGHDCQEDQGQRSTKRRGGGIEEFFGQLWWVPLSPSPRVGQPPPNLFWIRRDLWISKSFTTGDCFPVQPGDTLTPDPKLCTFAEDI